MLVVGLCIIFLCPPSLFSSRWKGSAYWGSKPRIHTAVVGRSGGVAVAMKDHGKARIYLYEPDAGLCPVTNGDFDSEPAWDPACNRIAYVSLSNGRKLTLRVLDLRGNSDAILIEEHLISQPQWSADGECIYFMRCPRDARSQSSICRLHLSTGSIATIASTTYRRPQAWCLLSGEERIAYVVNAVVWIKSIRSGDTQRLCIKADNPCMVAGSPDGRYLFVCDSRGAADKSALVMDMCTREANSVLDGYVRHALWSPCGRRLAIAGEYETRVLDEPFFSGPRNGMAEPRVFQGIGVCWYSNSELVLIGPNPADRYYLEQVNVVSGSVARLFPRIRQEPVQESRSIGEQHA